MKSIYFFLMPLLIAGACVERGSNNKVEDDQYSDAEDDPIASNNKIEEQAFTTSPYFSEWDTNGDQKVGQDEFYENYFNLVNQDNDEQLSEEEWQYGIQSFFGSEGDIKYGDYSEWDANGDGSIQAEEFNKYLNDTQYFSEWDGNGDDQLEEKEFAEEVFARWDTDDNGVIEAEEFTEWNNKTDKGI